MAELLQKFFSRVTGWDSQDPYEDEETVEEGFDPSPEISVPNEPARERAGIFSRRTAKVVDMRAIAGQQVVILHPATLEAAQEACNNLRAGRTVICNFERIDLKAAQRVVDFITGATYALDGQVHKVSPVIFLAVPHSTALVDDNAAEAPESVRIPGMSAAR